MRGRARLLLWFASVAFAAVSIIGLATNPLFLPFAQLGLEEARNRLDLAVAKAVDEDWLLPGLENAVARQDPDMSEFYLMLAQVHEVPVPDELVRRAQHVVAPSSGARAARCGSCALDVANCRSVSAIVACALPIELTPVGDLNALRRQAMNWVEDREVDRIETGLALVGLAATGGIVVTVGASATAKVGATLARVSWRSNRLTPRFSAALTEAAAIPVAWDRVADFVRGRASLEEVTDVARLARLDRLARDAGRLFSNTSSGDVMALMRHVEHPVDLARIARLSDVAGSNTRQAVEVLGVSRALRATTRITNGILAFVGLFVALAVQFLGLAASAGLRAVQRRLRQD